uniref:Uncharacterized protein n=1 Tax=Haptolina brevifila TaxID=156173 RepID=A0A7S2DZ32_9EUKA
MSLTEQPKGPKPLTDKDKEDLKLKLIRLEEDRNRLREEYKLLSESREPAIKNYKNIAAECRRKVEEIKSTSSAKLAAMAEQHERARQADAVCIAEFVKRNNEDANRINALERELASLKAAQVARDDSLPAFLRRLNLDDHLAALEEEELDVALLRSMGRDELVSNMISLGLTETEAAHMAASLFPAS